MQVLREEETPKALVNWKATEERWMKQECKEDLLERLAKGYRRYKYSLYHLNHVRVSRSKQCSARL